MRVAKIFLKVIGSRTMPLTTIHLHVICCVEGNVDGSHKKRMPYYIFTMCAFVLDRYLIGELHMKFQEIQFITGTYRVFPLLFLFLRHDITGNLNVNFWGFEHI